MMREFLVHLLWRFIPFRGLTGEAARRMAILDANARLQRAIDSDSLDERTVTQLTEFVHGHRDAVFYGGRAIRKFKSVE